jgi:glycosyltransferase involved in cell wall biosynthesis
VPYCYDSDRFRPAARLHEDPATLLTVSRLQPHKNQALTVEAAARLGPRVQVQLVGRGPDAGSLERLARSLGVRCRIETEADDHAVVTAYQRARVVVCPSRFEGFGLTPIEAIASGTPVVASNIPPHREFAAGAARFFPPDEVGRLVEAITAALEDERPDPDSVRQLTIAAAADRFVGLLRPLLG